MTYGLPDSVVVGTARRIGRTVSKKRSRRYEAQADFGWVFGWLFAGVLFGIAHLVQWIAGPF